MALSKKSYGSLFIAVIAAIMLLGAPSCDGRVPAVTGKNPSQQVLSKSDCGKTKGCFSKPDSCSSSNDCYYLLTYKPSESAVTFEMSSSEKWVSVGFNKDAIMDGTDSIICFTMNNSTAAIGHYAVKGHDTPQQTNPTPEGLTKISASYEGGVITCRFTRKNTDAKMEADLNDKYLYVIFASGRTESEVLMEHNWKAHSKSPVSLRKIQILEASEFDLSLIQIHGVLMVIAWVGFATIGMFIPRYMRSVWGPKEMCGKRVWFQVHRLIMAITVILTVTGISLAFVYVGEWSGDAGAHPFIGVTVLSIAVIQPVVALVRPPPDGKRRLLFNWAHRAVGLIVLALAVINIFLGSTLPAFHLDDSAVYVMIVYLLMLAVVVLFDIYLACKRVRDVSNYRVLSKPQDDEVELTPVPYRTQTDNKVNYKLYNIMFGVLIFLVSVICLAMMVLITAHE